MSERPVLVTGAFGLVGRAVVAQLASQGRAVVATDLDLPSHRAAARTLERHDGVAVRLADLTDPPAVQALVAGVVPGALVHLAAVIPPACYADRAAARRVNVDATRLLVGAAARLAVPPRLVLASSVAVYGARNPHRTDELLGPATPVAPCDLYGSHKVLAEEAVRSSGLEWVVLRLGGVLSPSAAEDAGIDVLVFERALPADGRLQTVDVRDVACAFAAAVGTSATGEVFLVGGDDSHRVRQGDLAEAMAGAIGLRGVLPPARPGDPGRDDAWFATDHMDTRRAQDVLAFQHRPLPGLLDEVRTGMRRRRLPLVALAPLLRRYLRRLAPYRARPGAYADPWAVIGERWGDPSPEDRAG